MPHPDLLSLAFEWCSELSCKVMAFLQDTPRECFRGYQMPTRLEKELQLAGVPTFMDNLSTFFTPGALWSFSIKGQQAQLLLSPSQLYKLQIKRDHGCQGRRGPCCQSSGRSDADIRRPKLDGSDIPHTARQEEPDSNGALTLDANPVSQVSANPTPLSYS